MYKLGAGIVTHPTAAKFQRGVTERQRVNSRDANIDGMRLHVLAVFCDSGRPCAEEFIARGSSISANNFYFRVRMPDGSSHIGKNVENLWIVVLDVARSMVAEEMIQLVFCSREIRLPDSIYDVDSLTGVSVVQAKMMRGGRTSFGGKARSAGHQGRKDEQTENRKKCDNRLQQPEPPSD